MSVDPISLGITIALTAANMAMTASRKIEGQRLDDLAVTIADFGALRNYFVGDRRFDGVPIIWAEKLREIQVKRKTKGGKLTNYEYQATFAFEVADQVSDAVTRMWFDKQLVYDMTGAGPPTLFSLKKGFVLADHIRIYLGDETQMPDPRMQATIDGEYGAGSTPAYRGKTIVVCEEIPVDKFGNRIPQIMVEAVTDSTPALVYEEVATGGSSGYDYAISQSAIWMAYFSGGGRIEWWDLPSRQPLSISSGYSLIGAPDMIGLAPDGTAYWMGFRVVGVDLRSNFYTCPPLGPATRSDDLDGAFGYGLITRAFDFEGGRYVYSTREDDGYFSSGIYINSAAGCARDFFQDQSGYIWGIFQPDGGGDEFSLVNMITGDSTTFTGLTSRADISEARGCATAFDTFFVVMDGNYYSIDQATMTIANSGAWSRGTDYDILPFQFPGLASWWRNLTEFSLQDGATIQTHPSGYAHGQAAFTATYDPLNQAQIMRPQFQAKLIWNYLGRVTGDSVKLQSVVERVHQIAGLNPADADAALLTQTIRGYNWTQGSGQDILEPLLDLFDVDARPHGFQLQYLPRGGAAGASISSDNFAVADSDAAIYAFTGTGGSDLPRALSMTFADADADQEPNSARSARPLDAVDGIEQERQVDMNTLVLTPEEAKALIDRYHRRLLFDAKPYALALTAQQIALEPGDVRPLALPSGSVTVRLKSVAFDADRSISTEWLRDDPSVAVLGSPEGAAMDGHLPQEIIISGPARVAILDVPLATDLHDGTVPFLYFGAGPYGALYFPGADIAISDTGLEGDFEASWATVDSSAAMDWGMVDALPEMTALPWIFDNGSVLNVRMLNGTLSSTTEADLLADAELNLALIAGEYIQFQTATLQGDGSYNLTGLLRGCRGTEAQIGNHSLGEMFVLMNSDIGRREVGAGEIGDTDAWRAASLGRDIDGALEVSLTFAANAHRPYAPVHGVLLRDTGSNDWTISATRRTRIGGANVDGSNVPLGEVSEAWEVDIMNGSTVVRTLTGSTLPLTYTSAQQVADWGSNQTVLEVNLYQMSPALSLRGFELNIAA